jgi:hypothetical protein
VFLRGVEGFVAEPGLDGPQVYAGAELAACGRVAEAVAGYS